MLRMPTNEHTKQNTALSVSSNLDLSEVKQPTSPKSLNDLLNINKSKTDNQQASKAMLKRSATVLSSQSIRSMKRDSSIGDNKTLLLLKEKLGTQI